MKKQWKLDNKGMTLLEVIVAFAIFAIAATILITGFNGALKVMGNSEKIKNASQENTGKLNAVGASALEEFEGLQNSEITTIPEKSSETTMLTLTFDKNKYAVPGRFYIATSTEKTDMDMKMFQPEDSIKLSMPSLEIPNKEGKKEEPPGVPGKPEDVTNGKVGKDSDIFNPAGQYTNQAVHQFNVGFTDEGEGWPQKFSAKNSGGKSTIRQLYFQTKPVAIDVKNNVEVCFDLDFLLISGNITIADLNNDKIILTNKESHKQANRGSVLVYFGQEKTTIGNVTDIEQGYYLLPTEEGLDLLKMSKADFDACNIKHKSISEQNQIVSDYVTNLFV